MDERPVGADRVRVALDVTPAGAGITGVARYTAELWRALARQPSVDLRPFQVGLRLRPNEARHLRVPLRLVQSSWRRLRRPTAERIVGEVDIVHSIDAVAPPTRHPLIVTVHDLIALSRPELFAPRAVSDLEGVVRQARGAAAIITTCEATADEIAKVTGIDREQLLVASPGLSSMPAPSPEPPIPEPYVLAVGGVTPRKGYEVLAQAATEMGPSCPPILVAGPDYWGSESVRAEVERHDRHHRIRFLGDIDDAELATLYAHATVVCHPSHAEGFGFPCLEAMAAGVPVVASDLPSIREMTAGAAALVPPADPTALAAALSSLLGDEARRASLVAIGRARAATYSWDSAASAVVDAYERIRASGRR